MPVHLLLPLASSLLYVVAALFLKQASARGVGVMRSAFVCNGITALVFMLLWPLGGRIPSSIELWQPALVAVLFVGGQVSTMLALGAGDVTVATPVMGVKVVLVTFFTTWIMADPVRPAMWIAAAISCLGIGLVSRGTQAQAHHHVLRTAGLALAAASSYALFDVLVMKWSGNWGVGRFLPITMILGATLSLLFVPFFEKLPSGLDRAASRALFCGAAIMALQAILLVTTVAHFGDAAAVNVVYGLRGMWSVLAVWLVGSWFGNREQATSPRAMHWRLFGAVLLSGAVALVFV